MITSRDNPQVKLLVSLAERKKERDRTGCFAAEGLRLCLDAVRSGVVMPTLLLTNEAAERYPETAELMEYAGRTVFISHALAQRIADTNNTQGIFAICEKLDNGRCAVKIKSGGLYLLAHALQDPGNLGTILRTAEAMGIDGVILDGCPDPYAPKMLRGAMGGIFRLPVAVTDDITAEIALLRKAGVPVYAAALTDKARPAGQVDFSGGGAVLIGNEGNGLPEELIGACNDGILIPMARGANSLNAAMAAGILMWEMRRWKQGN